MVDGGGDNEQTAWGVGEIAVTNPPAGHWFMYIYPDTPCMPYMPISWGDFGGQCRHIWHTWSVWDIYIYICGMPHVIFQTSLQDWRAWRSAATS